MPGECSKFIKYNLSSLIPHGDLGDNFIIKRFSPGGLVEVCLVRSVASDNLQRRLFGNHIEKAVRTNAGHWGGWRAWRPGPNTAS